MEDIPPCPLHPDYEGHGDMPDEDCEYCLELRDAPE